MPGYRGGHILRIKVKNFMTYDELEIFPNHGLNLIIGLNGSGKSTIMCAICLGLAGKPQFTGRSAQLSDFIKYGCDKATIEIELENPSRKNVVIVRIIQNEKSTWLLNNASVPLSEIQKAVKKFNIDVSNLCQFLPQEKVTEFSKMDKKQRLENMLQAIGEPHLFSLFKELKQMKLDSLKLEEEKKRHENVKDTEEQKNQRLKVDVDKHEEKLRMKEHLKSLKQNKMILEYEEIKTQLINIKKEKKPIKEQGIRVKKMIQDIEEKNSAKSKILQESIDVIKNMKGQIASYKNFISKKESEMSELHEKVQNGKIHYQNKLEEKRNQIAMLSKIATQKQALQELHNKNLTEQPIILEKDKALSRDLDVIKNQLTSLTSTHAYTNIEKNKLEYSIRDNMTEIEKMKNEENKKLEFLKHRFKDVYEAVIWLQQNKDRFRAPIYPPMLLLLKVNNDDHRKYIENSVGLRDLIAFLCEDKEDNKLLTNILRVQKCLNVNIAMVPDNPIEYYASPPVSPDLRQRGIKCFVKDLVEVPDAVMRFLCQCYKLHMIPVCISTAERHMDLILQRFPVFFSPDARISGKRSKYGDRNFCIRRDPIKGKNILQSSKDHSERLQLLMAKSEAEQNEMNALVSKLQNLEEQIKELERNENTLRDEKRCLLEKLKDINNTERQLYQKTQSYERKKTELVDEVEEKRQIDELIQGINAQKIKICSDVSNILQGYIRVKSQTLGCHLKARFIRKRMEGVRKTLSEKKEEAAALERRFVELDKTCEEIKNQGFALYAEIVKFLPAGDEEKRKQIDLSENQTIEDINKDIRRIQAQLDLNCEENEAVLAEYNDREKKIAETRKEIETYEQKLKRLQEEMSVKKEQFKKPLETHINNINTKFSKYYKQLNCTGEITLDTCNDSDDFPKYGMQINLKYRDNEPLMELSNTHHSGGECSVAAIIFILSLQELTEVPFRCIDEINQGMDSQNERNIYNLIADSAKSGSCSQYFLLTPKLLMDLEMIEHRDVAVHVIYNSSFLEMKMDVKKHIGTKHIQLTEKN